MKAQEFVIMVEGYREAEQEFVKSNDVDQVKKMIDAYRSLVDRNQVKGQERNIDYWRKQGWDTFSRFVQAKSQERSKTQVKRVRGITTQQITLRDDADWLIVIPLDKDTSCFHGRGTDWCTTKAQDRQFEQYFYENYVVLIYCIKKSTGGMWAIAYDGEYNEVELFDQDNKQLSLSDFQSQTRLLPQTLIRQASTAQNKATMNTARHSWEDAEDELNNLDFAQISPEQRPEIERLLLFVKDPFLMMNYAETVIRGRWPAVEPFFMRSPVYAYGYANNVIHGRWPAAEAVIASEPEWAYRYATDVIKGRFPAGEPVIASDPNWAYRYAKNVIKGRFPAGEPVIARSLHWNRAYAQAYAKDIIQGPWPEAGIK